MRLSLLELRFFFGERACVNECKKVYFCAVVLVELVEGPKVEGDEEQAE